MQCITSDGSSLGCLSPWNTNLMITLTINKEKVITKTNERKKSDSDRRVEK